ncbi:NADPH-cytochrome P450 reductase [Scenedesmus sp. NREL 46B-D3]|nr:NADPH-cytochrome P450 reductase [Scenedesmus sp. NREL 46B-D3]
MEPATVAPGPLSPGIAVASLVLLVFTILLLYLKPKSSIKRASTAAEEDLGKPSVRILYGTQTGTAERFSKQLGNELRRKYGDGTLVEVVDIENYKAERRLPKERLVLFLMATYGDGEPTDNAADFYSWVCNEVEDVENGVKDRYLEGVHYGVFGLGNKQYEHFNAVGKKMHTNMEALGATPVCSRGDGDDDDSIDDDFEKWCTELFAALDAQPELLGAAAVGGGGDTLAAYRVEVLGAGCKAASPFPDGSGSSAHDPYWAVISEVRELHTAASGRNCVHVEIDISGNSQLKYETGDHLGMYARNSEQVVIEMAALLGLPLDTSFKLHTEGEGASGDLDAPFPGPIQLSTALAYFADLLSSPHKDALLALASCASDAKQAEQLKLLASAAGKAQYTEYIAKQQRSLMEVMRDFRSAKPTLGLFFGSVAPRLAPRYYSISSSAAKHPRSVHVTCAVVRDALPSGRVRDGVCSSYLQRSAPGERVPMFIRRSTFKLPADAHTPIVMVGPGTGLAPFRGFIQERQALIEDMAEVGPAVLFFGCRHRGHDYIYEAELEGAVECGALSQLHVAFSRAGPVKDYVQHHMEANGAAVWELLQQPGACVYVCGDAKNMAKDVHRALIGIAQSHGSMSSSQAEGWVKRLGDGGRYHKDVW